jgi:hypothetical protein
MTEKKPDPREFDLRNVRPEAPVKPWSNVKPDAPPPTTRPSDPKK